MIEFKMPSLGADMDEGTLLEWKVKPGDEVRRGQIVAVVDTTKAAVDVESWEEGTVHKLLIEPGDTVAVGTVIALLLSAGESPEAAEAWTPPQPAPAEAPPPAAPIEAVPPPPTVGHAGRRRISPAARRRAEELKTDLDRVTGTGPEGVVTLQDVERAATEAAPVDRAAAMRQTIAAAMSRSKREIPHYYLAEPVPLRRASEWLGAHNADRPITGRLLMVAVFVKALATILKDYPEFNGHYVDGRFAASEAIHVGMAITQRQGGLIAPALLDVGGKGWDQLMADLTDLIARTRAGRLRSAELSSPTITVSNLGDQGVQAVYGVIYPPQVALVGFGRVAPQPWVIDGSIAAVPAVTATLAADHRVSDGHRGGLFLAALRDALQQPEQL